MSFHRPISLIKALLVFATLSATKIFAKIFFRFKVTWTTPYPADWNRIRCIGVLNHTSLYEPLLVAIYPFSQLWRAARHMVAPAADITMDRRFVGLFFSLLGQHIIPISRKRDESWQSFLNKIKIDSLVVILPEGRMMRSNGKDKHGKHMDIRPGIADVLAKMNEGLFMIVTSGGLHHIQRPGQLIPKLFNTIKIVTEIHDIFDLKCKLLSQLANTTKSGDLSYKMSLIQFLEERKKQHLELMGVY